jgi:hypothetical protein
MRVAHAYALAAVFFLAAPPSQAGLPPNSYLDNEVRLEQDHQLYGQPFNNEEADKVVVTVEDRSADVWALGYIPELVAARRHGWVALGPTR